MNDQVEEAGVDRRRFLNAAIGAGAGIVLAGCAASGTRGRESENAEKKESGEAEDVAPAEDLMREHGVLKRILLVYGEAIRRIDASQELPPELIADSAKIIRNFIEDYHEKLEEDHLFPRFRKANKLVDLVDVLTQQHQAGRRVTDITIRYANLNSLKNPDERRQLVESMRQFIRMYNPHEAREDTVLFPALHEIIRPNEYDALGEDFERKEHQLFGQDGFENMVGKVGDIEKSLGIYELSQFTPRM